MTPENDTQLDKHVIDKIETKWVRYQFVRSVGKNARLDVHGIPGVDKEFRAVKLYTNQGATG